MAKHTFTDGLKDSGNDLLDRLTKEFTPQMLKGLHSLRVGGVLSIWISAERGRSKVGTGEMRWASFLARTHWHCDNEGPRDHVDRMS